MVRRSGKEKHSIERSVVTSSGDYGRLVTDITQLLEQARRGAVRSVNAILTATYWEIGRRIVEHEQGGKGRATYGEEVLNRLSEDLSRMHGRGFSARNLRQMRTFFLGWEIWQTPSAKFEARVKFSTELEEEGTGIFQTVSGKSPIAQTVSALIEDRVICESVSREVSGGQKQTRTGKSGIWQTVSAKSSLGVRPGAFPLSWSHYVSLMAVEKPHARLFYESEAIRGGWSVRQLDRQIGTQFFERTAQAKNPEALLARGQQAKVEDAVGVMEEVRDPYLLEFLDLKDEYSESELEEGLIRHLESFLLELGAGFTFVARQKRIRIGSEWYRMDLLLFHRRLRCLVVVDLKVGKFTHGDAGQMNLYLNYVREHMMEAGENEPVGLVLCSAKDDAVVHYAMGGIKAKVFASQYLTALPDVETLRREMVTTQHALEGRVMKRQKGS